MSTVWILFILAICGISLVFNIFSYTKHNAKLAKFTEEHPQAAKVSVKANKIGIIVENLNVLSVNGEQPLIYQEKLINTGFYLLPGKNILEVSYDLSRPGILHKRVTTYYDPCKIEVEAEPNKEYKLSYDRKKEEYEFEEVKAV